MSAQERFTTLDEVDKRIRQGLLMFDVQCLTMMHYTLLKIIGC